MTHSVRRSLVVATLFIATFVLPAFHTSMAKQQITLTPTLERLEVVTATAGSTADGGNEWGNHKNRIARTPDGNLYTVVQAPGTDNNLNKQWQLYKRTGTNSWHMMKSANAGREPANLLAGPNNEVYVIAWPGGLPYLWTSTNGGSSWTKQAIGTSSTWVTNNWPYAGAGIAPNGDLYLVQVVGGSGNCCNTPGYFYWAFRSYVTGQWTFKVTTYDYRDTYPYVLPTDTGTLNIVGAKTGYWSDFGYSQPPAAGGFNYVYKAVRDWYTPDVATTEPSGTIVKEVSQLAGEYVNAFQNDAYRATDGRVHVMYTYRDATTGATPTSTGTYQGAEAIVDTGNVTANANYTAIHFPNQARIIQDTTGLFWVMTTGNNNTIEISQAGTDGLTISPYTTLSTGAYNPSGPSFIAAPRNGSSLQNYVDGVFPTNNGAGWVYYRIGL